MQQLEQAIGYLPRIEIFAASVNLLERGVLAFYTGDKFELRDNGIVIPYGNLGIEGLRDLHDTFKLDGYGNVYGGHTTADGRFRINTDPLRSRADDILGR